MELRLSYESEPGDRLYDLGKGRVLIKNPQKQDRVLDRNTGEIVEGPSSEWRNMGRHVLMTLVLFAAICLVFYVIR